MAYKALTVEELLQLMKKIQGEKTNTEFAAEIGISKQYLTDIYNGRKVPSDGFGGAGLPAPRRNALSPVSDRRQPGDTPCCQFPKTQSNAFS
jgi:hypothetical protein